MQVWRNESTLFFCAPGPADWPVLGLKSTHCKLDTTASPLSPAVLGLLVLVKMGRVWSRENDSHAQFLMASLQSSPTGFIPQSAHFSPLRNRKPRVPIRPSSLTSSISGCYASLGCPSTKPSYLCLHFTKVNLPGRHPASTGRPQNVKNFFFP